MDQIVWIVLLSLIAGMSSFVAYFIGYCRGHSAAFKRANEMLDEHNQAAERLKP